MEQRKGGNSAQIEGYICICISAMGPACFSFPFSFQVQFSPRGCLHADRILSTLD
jgi:hypothetical protein